MSDGGGAWKGHVLFFLGAGSVSVCPSQGSKSRGGPKYGTGTGTHTVRYQSPMSNPACRIANTGPFQFTLFRRFCFNFNFPSVIIITANQPTTFCALAPHSKSPTL